MGTDQPPSATDATSEAHSVAGTNRFPVDRSVYVLKSYFDRLGAYKFIQTFYRAQHILGKEGLLTLVQAFSRLGSDNTECLIETPDLPRLWIDIYGYTDPGMTGHAQPFFWCDTDVTKGNP